MILSSPVAVSGIGLHTGASARVIVHPAPFGAGIAFQAGGEVLPARASQVVDTSRCTVLGSGASAARVSTIEHLMSALLGLGIVDALVAVEGPELPIGDGSAQMWIDALGPVATPSDSARSPLTLSEPVIETGKDGQFIAAFPSPKTSVTVAVSFPHPLVGTQVARWTPEMDYASEIGLARTFGFIEEVEALQKAGLALGGSFENAVVVYPDHYSVPLRFPDELARHKLLDVLGDLNLTGFSTLPQADIIAVKPSHRLNVAFAARLAAVAAPPTAPGIED